MAVKTERERERERSRLTSGFAFELFEAGSNLQFTVGRNGT